MNERHLFQLSQKQRLHKALSLFSKALKHNDLMLLPDYFVGAVASTQAFGYTHYIVDDELFAVPSVSVDDITTQLKRDWREIGRRAIDSWESEQVVPFVKTESPWKILGTFAAKELLLTRSDVLQFDFRDEQVGKAATVLSEIRRKYQFELPYQSPIVQAATPSSPYAQSKYLFLTPNTPEGERYRRLLSCGTTLDARTDKEVDVPHILSTHNRQSFISDLVADVTTAAVVSGLAWRVMRAQQTIPFGHMELPVLESFNRLFPGISLRIFRVNWLHANKRYLVTFGVDALRELLLFETSTSKLHDTAGITIDPYDEVYCY